MKQFKVKSSTLKKGFFCLLVPTMLFTQKLTAQLSGYTYGKTITIQGSRIAGPVTNFPVLISFTDPSLRTTGNDGRVQNANGYDIVFTLPDCSTILPMQIERYVASSGEYVAWVQLPSLTNGSNTMIYMFYGKTGVVANPSTASVWDANYMGVYHFNSSVTDGTANGRNLTDNSTANVTAKIGEGRRLNNNSSPYPTGAATRHLQLPSNIFNTVTNFTFEGWVYLETVNTSWERIFDFGRNTTFNMFLTPSMAGNGVKRFAITINGNGTEQQVSSATTTGTGAWHHFAVTIDASTNTGTLYYDGAVNATNTGLTLRPSNLGTNTANYFGRSQYAADEGFYGNFDEFRISSTARNASWITTSYNNQNSPATFYTVSAEVVAGALCAALPVTISAFDAKPEADAVTISWTAEQESAGDTYILERSGNGSSWEAINTITATGSSAAQKHIAKDPAPLYPVTYYRLQQRHAGGSISYSQVVTAKLDDVYNNNKLVVHPNPARDHVQISLQENVSAQHLQVELLSNTGISIPLQPVLIGNMINLKLPKLGNGVYFLNVYIKGRKYSSKILIAQ
ncbi:DUF2341 domain-containing protein [Longitalea arenae]|uniref:DUF2341 domain-containing protein n=1 Tax=Longitalea arenae TaxID=2812558 RepID=UPI00196882AA|nr:DUF2341 domain-containing protein [Longitalea arenae]